MLTMKVGDKITVFIPAHLAYGEGGVPGAIPPNSDLIFEMELVDIVEYIVFETKSSIIPTTPLVSNKPEKVKTTLHNNLKGIDFRFLFLLPAIKIFTPFKKENLECHHYKGRIRGF